MTQSIVNIITKLKVLLSSTKMSPFLKSFEYARMNVYSLKPIGISLVFLCLISCVEPIEINTNEFESILVVEGIITDEEKHQTINLSRSYKLEEDGPAPVSDAIVKVVNSNGESFDFSETSAGVYKSLTEFRVEYGVGYTLQIETNSGYYESTSVTTNSETNINTVGSLRTTVNDTEGVAITVDNSADDQSYYKFEYEETYEIRSPYEKFWELIINEEDEIERIPKEEQDYICYVTENSEDIVLSNTGGLSENALDGFLVRFISRNDYALSYRYSILVKQLEISPEAYSYYETLQNLSETENIFSQYQPGFLSGNILNTEENDEPVIGFFTTAAVDEQRHFFSFSDYFDPASSRASHTGDCNPFIPSPQDLRTYIEEGAVELFLEEPGPIYVVIRASCVDCTYLGSNERPEFWID